jgi:hypothetical protein
MDTTVFLSPKDAELFKAFCEHYSDFLILKENGIFDVKNGNMTLHWNNEGILQKVEVNNIRWKAPKLIETYPLTA